MFAARACGKGLINKDQRKRIEKAGRRTKPIGWLVFVVAMLVSVVPWHNTEVSVAHSKYKSVVGTIIRPPQGFKVPKGESMAMVNFRGWYGEPETILFATTKHLKPNTTETVVISKNDGAWIASDSAGPKENPRNPNIWTAVLRGFAIGLIGGLIIYGILQWIIESLGVRKIAQSDRREKQLIKDRATSSP